MKTAMLVLVSVVAIAGLGPGCKQDDKPEPAATAEDAAAPALQGADAAAPAAAAPAAAVPDAAATTWCGAAPCPCKPGSEQNQGGMLSICELEQPTTIQGYACEAGRVVFHPGGELEECLAAGEVTIDGYACKGTPLSVAWHASGRLRNCTLAKDATIDPITITAGRGVQLYGDGKLKNGWTDTPVTVGAYACHKELRLFPDGTLLYCTLAASATIGDQEVPAGSQVRLTDAGALRGLRLGADAEVAGKKAKQEDSFCFEDGAVVASHSCWMF
jgi:hypothetical protein